MENDGRLRTEAAVGTDVVHGIRVVFFESQKHV